jgi:hypothetical protein
MWNVIIFSGKITITIFTNIIVRGTLFDIIYRKGLKINRLRRRQAIKSCGMRNADPVTVISAMG